MALNLGVAKRTGLKFLSFLQRSRVCGEVDVSTFSIGTRVVISEPKASRYKCKAGDAGVIVKCCLLSGCHDVRPDSDMYFVLLDSGVAVYCNYPDLRLED